MGRSVGRKARRHRDLLAMALFISGLLLVAAAVVTRWSPLALLACMVVVLGFVSAPNFEDKWR